MIPFYSKSLDREVWKLLMTWIYLISLPSIASYKSFCSFLRIGNFISFISFILFLCVLSWVNEVLSFQEFILLWFWDGFYCHFLSVKSIESSAMFLLCHEHLTFKVLRNIHKCMPCSWSWVPLLWHECLSWYHVMQKLLKKKKQLLIALQCSINKIYDMQQLCCCAPCY